jgi:hypothetical protein
VIDKGDRDPADLARELPLEGLSPALVGGAVRFTSRWAERPWHGHFPFTRTDCVTR